MADPRPKPSKAGIRLQVVVDNELLTVIDGVMFENHFESYPQTLRYMLKHFSDYKTILEKYQR